MEYLDSLSVEKTLTYGAKVTVPTSTATTASGSLTLTAASNLSQYLTGTASGFVVNTPDATTLALGQRYEIYNQSSMPVTVKDGAGATLFTLSQTSISYLVLQTNSTAAGGWIAWQVYSNSASGIVNYRVISSTAFTTASASDVMITGFTVTPTAGTYAVWYNSSVLVATSPVVHNWTIYKAGSTVADSLRNQQSARSNQVMFDATNTITQVDGTQAIDVRVNSASGNLTVNQRSMILIRLGA